MVDMPWLRLYTDTVDNEKLRLLAFEDRWHFIALLCLKQQGILDKDNELLERKIAVKLGVQLRELDEIKKRLMDVHLIDSSWLPIGWETKQFKSDSSTERTRKYRKVKALKEGNVTETSRERLCDAIDTESESDTEQKEKQKSSRFTPPTIEQVKKYINEKSFDIDGDKFLNFYEAKGWMIGKNKMKSWKACVRTWNTKKSDGQDYGYGGI